MDIFHEWDPVTLAGAGWYSKEKNPAGKRFRWAGDGAWLDIAQLPGLAYDVTFEVEPGPAVGLEQFDLAVYADGKHKLASLPVAGRTQVAFRLPPGDPRVHHLELRAENGGKPVEAPGDPRTLRYRVFSVSVTPVPDVSHLEKQIHDRDGELSELRAKAQKLEDGMASEVEAHVAELSQLQREVDARDAIIERLEQTAGRYRAEVEELQRVLEATKAQLSASQQLAEERLAVIRAMHDQSQAPAS